MDRFNALGRGLQVMFVAGVLLFIDTFFDWQSVDTAIGSFGVSAWDDIGGIIMALLTIVLVAWLAARVAGVAIPLPISDSVLAAAFGALIFLLALIKNLQDDYSSAWAWIGLILAAAILVGAWLQIQATGGMDALRTQLPSMPASSTGTSTGSTTAAAPPPQPSAAPSDTAQPAPPPPPAAPPPMGEPAAPAEETPPEERPAEASGLEPSTEPPEERR
jgi:hypothetical protein